MITFLRSMIVYFLEFIVLASVPEIYFWYTCHNFSGQGIVCTKPEVESQKPEVGMKVRSEKMDVKLRSKARMPPRNSMHLASGL
jgi:hypothetical protein